MLCQSCQKKQANTHIKTVVNGELTEMVLCSDCATKMGYGNVFSSMFDIGSLMSGFMGEPATAALATERRCPKCGMAFSEISKSGRVGCAKCYDIFYERLLPSIKRIHGNTIHTGKKLHKPRLASGVTTDTVAKSNANEVSQLSKQLEVAVANQESEKAAQLRDRINELKSQQGGNE